MVATTALVILAVSNSNATLNDKAPTQMRGRFGFRISKNQLAF
jgi:hypothetical protein